MASNLISYAEWEDTYGPIIRIEDFNDPRLKDASPALIWTLVDGDEGTTIVSGWHFVNRLEYYISAKPVNPGEFVEVE